MSKPWDKASQSFRAELAAAVPTETLKRLHQIDPVRHFLVLFRQLLIVAASVYVILRWGALWYAWMAASVCIGFVVFSFSVLLHEVVHNAVFRDRASRWTGLLAVVYGITSGLSPSQFTRWHLDHHDHLGTTDGDPKRRYLTPRIVRRWFKLLYFTPALFPIYFRAARQAMAAYPPELRQRIRRERLLATAAHLAVPALLWVFLGFEVALAIHLVPVFVVFPIAFALNRLGQHYDIDPDDPAKWGTLIRPSPMFWDRIYLWSNYHLEHHYFPKVPFYNLPELHRELRGFFAERGWTPRTYAGLLWGWLVLNRTPHTRWR